MSIANIPYHLLDQAIESAVADIGNNSLTLSAISADLRYHRNALRSLRNDLRDMARNFQRACVNASIYEAERLTNEYESARLVLQEREDQHKAAVTRLERAKSKFLWREKEIQA